jgi:hypothetical protein
LGVKTESELRRAMDDKIKARRLKKCEAYRVKGEKMHQEWVKANSSLLRRRSSGDSVTSGEDVELDWVKLVDGKLAKGIV